MGFNSGFKGLTKHPTRKTTNIPLLKLSDKLETMEQEKRIFERHILRKIFGPVNIDNIWRIRNNMEIDNLIEGADIVRFIRAQRIKCLGHIHRMDQTRAT